MPLDLPDGTQFFIDANVLYYALVPTLGLTEVCVPLVDRIQSGVVIAYSSISALSDVVHKVMMYEAAKKSGRPRAGIVGWLKRHPNLLAILTEYHQAVSRLIALPLKLLSVDSAILKDAALVAANHQLLMSDAQIVALMRRHSIVNLVTNDDDFDRVPSISVWKPR